MEYTALYRKYRPTKWEEVVGQKHITTALTNQINNDAISHAYLFCGTRGTGKTTIARIFAKSINCEHPVNGSPCGKCDTCKALSDVNNLDIIEIDAASNNRVDEIRELREKVKYPPINGKYKVYIIDEVHMLTDSAFNALLKTLEEPPTYVVFILGTTEVQKLPATILSRCLRFDFKLIGQDELEKLLTSIFDDCNYKYEKEAVSLIARLGQGSARDMLSIADMCVAYTNGCVTYKAVIDAVGATDKLMLGNLATYLLEGDISKLLTGINDVAGSGKNLAQLAKDLAGYFRDVIVVKTCDNYESILKMPKEDLNQLEKLAKYDVNVLLDVLKKLSGLEQEFRYTQTPRALLEVVLLGIATDNKKNGPKTIALAANAGYTVTKNVDDVLNEQSHQGKSVLGKLLVSLRNAEEYKNYVLLGTAKKADLMDNKLNVYMDKDNYESLCKDKNLDNVNSYLSKIDENLSINPVLDTTATGEKKDVTTRLQQEYGDIFTINQ